MSGPPVAENGPEHPQRPAFPRATLTSPIKIFVSGRVNYSCLFLYYFFIISCVSPCVSGIYEESRINSVVVVTTFYNATENKSSNRSRWC